VTDELQLETRADWQKLRDDGLSIVLDPMVFRAGDLFLGGRSGTYGSPNETWGALSANVAGLAVFFDAIVLNEQLPIFDYGITFPEYEQAGAGASHRLVPLVNANGDVLRPVRLHEHAYLPFKEAALEELAARPSVSPADRISILDELDAFRYQWLPTLPGFESASDDERRLATFLYGGLLFAGYAQELRGTHVLQQRRARLFGRVSLGTAADDQQLFARLAALPEAAPDAVVAAVEIPQLPSVLPYLLAEAADNPVAMLQAALALRADPDIVAYREWHGKLLDEVALGRRPNDQLAELETVRAAVTRKRAGRKLPFRLSFELVAFFVPVLKLETHVDGEAAPRAAWGWGVRKIHGDHRKVLTRLVAAKDAFDRLDLALKEAWERG
jgi:hypothetical protein